MVSGSIELLTAYAQDIEHQVAKGIEDYKLNAKLEVHGEEFGEEAVQVVEFHKGLDDQGWSLGEIFGVYFPNLQRRSALITLYSFFEHELDKLCRLLQAQEKYKVSVVDMNGSGVERACAYIEKVATVDTHKKSREWEDIQGIRLVRNLIVHSDGQLVDAEGKPRNREDAYIGKTPLLDKDDDEVLILEGYLAYVLSKFDGYFKLLAKSIELKYGA